MSDTKVYQFGETGNSSLNALLPFLQQRGIDPAYLAGLMGGNNNGGFFGNGNALEGIIALIVVAAIFGNGNGGGLFGGGGNQQNAVTDLLSNEIQRNGVAISQLASSLNCSVGDIQNAINNVATQICNLSAQSGQSALQIINSVQAGNAQITSALAECCCKTQTAIQESNYLTERGFCNTNQILSRGFSDLGYAFRDQTCDLKQSANANTASIIAKLDAIEDSRKDRELAEKDRMIATLTARSERQAELQPIYAALSDIQCKQPPTFPMPYVPASGSYIPVSYSVPMHFGTNYNNCGYNYGC